MRRRKRINKQKLFSFISLIFILTCCIWYGGRAVYFYMETHKTTKTKEITLTKKLMTGNKNLKKKNEEYYYYQNADNNYIIYSNLVFRILKITKDDKLVLISDEPITNLAMGTESTYKESNIINWLNTNTTKKNSGILEKNLNDPNKYLVENKTCTDSLDDIKKLTCNDISNEKISLLTINDYINTGSTKSFINNGNTTYLANTNSEKEKWLIDEDGKLTTDDGSGIYGVKIVITLKENTNLKSGDGSINDPYKFEEDNTYFGSYIKLDDDIWRVYSEEDDTLKLSLNDYLKEQGEALTYIYSSNNSFHNDTIYGSLAYYLNKTYLNNLSYKDSIITNNYSNGYYTSDEDYDYSSALESKADTKVSNLSIGDVILNNSLDGYFLATGLYNKSDYVYIAKKNGNTDTIKVTKEAKIVPCISINKNKLTKGSGTKDDPYRME